MTYRTFLANSRPILQRLFSEVKKVGAYGLTEKEMADLREVWRVVEQAPLPVSKLFFKELFDRKPEYQKKFKYGGPSLLHNNDFVPHMRAVISSINSIIRKLEDEKSVNQVMEYVASSHKGRQVHREEFVNTSTPNAIGLFQEMGKSVKKTLKDLNTKKFNSDMEAAFDKFWSAFVEDFVQRIDKIEKETPVKPAQPPAKK